MKKLLKNLARFLVPFPIFDDTRIKPPTSTNGLTSGELWNSNGVAHFMP
ncbi:MAG TPA: hypothetical protein PLT37_01480 [Kiritimatiellia bacterium]|mgnify:FL=1|jgi:hypothetical protein|nr:hypothetical protein [Kiritimatiellia bacterium]MBP9571484.1 hypothetical protein [Kiritimatiellia bacterium]HQF19897.1 hypothetical protein [Kiritimatiellia bacterium]HQG73815.1 hypothetical protein [Kiritimatiellia bacterium]HXK78569.1 hypothetical protein [Kiritimatiellia bacterium]